MRTLEEKDNLVTANPVELLIYVSATGKDPRFVGMGQKLPFQTQEEALEQSRKDRDSGDRLWVPIEGKDYPANLETRLLAAKSAANYVNPKLAMVQSVTEMEADEIAREGYQVSELAKIPAIRDMMEAVQTAVAGYTEPKED